MRLMMRIWKTLKRKVEFLGQNFVKESSIKTTLPANQNTNPKYRVPKMSEEEEKKFLEEFRKNNKLVPADHPIYSEKGWNIIKPLR